jgi:hypothetical protein
MLKGEEDDDEEEQEEGNNYTTDVPLYRKRLSSGDRIMAN